MNNSLATVYRYLAAWHETKSPHRLELIRQTFAEDAVYIDPLSHAIGYDAIEQMMAQFSEKLPGAAFMLTSDIAQQDRIVRYDWKLTAINGSTLVKGSDHVQLAEDGRFRYVIGFYTYSGTPETTFETAANTFATYQQKIATV